ncbi:MAG: hypothetical protein JWM95_4078 [Gemmatimonadetes bacterium]|nr:hypothetical protein [Gemmatimonadota bacterium]
MPESSRRSHAFGWYWRLVFRLAKHRASHDIRVGTLGHSAEEANLLFAKIDAALSLIARYDPRRLARLVRNARGILVIGTVGGIGVWSPGACLVRLREDYLLAADVSPTHVASTLVHEGTHAWLSHLGFGYEEHRRQRIEAICYRSEIAFARRVPDGEMLLPALEAGLALDPGYYSTATRREQDFTDLRTLGVPEPLIKLVKLLSARRAA